MNLLWDQGTLLLRGAESASALPGVLWDPRVGAWRSPIYAHPMHARLAQLSPGHAVSLRVEGDAIRVVDSSGLPVATLSAAARARWTPILDQIQSAAVLAVRERGRAESHPDWRHQLQVERWRVPVVEVQLAAHPPCSQPEAPPPRPPG